MREPITIERDAEFPRRYVPKGADCGLWETVESLLRELLGREIGSPAALEQWLLDQSEVFSCSAEESARRYIAMTCDTEDPDREKRYLYIVETLRPKSKPLWHKLDEKYLASPHCTALDGDRYFVMNRATKTSVEIFREENIPLETEEDKLKQQYQKVSGAMTAVFRGKELPMAQLRPYLEEADRATREEAWRLETDRRLQDRDTLDEIFDRMIELREQIARNAGFDNFVDYTFKHLGRFDYAPADCHKYHEAVEKTVVPALREIQEARRKQLTLPALRPWDMAVDPKGRSPLRPYKGGEALAKGCLAIFEKMDAAFGGQFADMTAKGLLDLESRKGKAPGGYQETLYESRLPFIFMNAAGTDGDVYTLLHEGGHAFHALAARMEPLAGYRHAPIEFCEVASMSMELLCEGKLGSFYHDAEEARSLRGHLEGLPRLLAWIAQVDAFQHWIYTHKGNSRDERRAAWLALDRRFGGDTDWTGVEAWRESAWQRQLHLFECPFYYIEYGIAQLGALQVWRNYRRDGTKAVERLRAAFALGGSRPVPELFETAGAKFEFSAATIGPLMDMLMETLRGLPD